MNKEIMSRKIDHVRIGMTEDVKAHYDYWNDIDLVHYALPDIDLEDIDVSIQLFGKKLNAPIIIEGMTGGHELSKKINKNLGKAAEIMGIGMGVGSQRALLTNPEVEGTYSIIKDYAIPLKIANIGVPQLILQKASTAINAVELGKLMDIIGADLIAFHLNYLQELVQPEGDHKSKGVLNKIAQYTNTFPIIVKETGAGISREVALRLRNTGIKGIDVGGAGGTSFAAVEYYRARKITDYKREKLGALFWDWGIPAPASIYSLRDIGIPLIGSGGIDDGVKLAKAIVMGADCGGIARALLKPANQSVESVVYKINTLIYELKATMFLVNARNIHELKMKKFILHGLTKDWVEQL